MSRQLHKLSARSVSAAKKPGRYGDGGGLYLVVAPGTKKPTDTEEPQPTKKWVLRYVDLNGRRRDMGLGSARDGDVSLAAARLAAAEAREHLRCGRDPISERKRQGNIRDVPTFGTFADELVAELEPGFRNEKHRAQWRMTLKHYAVPLRSKKIDEISTEDVLAVLKPIWRSKAETASRLRGRIERVLDAAKAKGLRTGDNPAMWRGHLALLLPRPAKLTRGHHAALPFDQAPEFMVKLRETPAGAARALEFVILTASRTGEAIGAKVQEIDFQSKVWTIPASRMKAGREHRVPLSDAAMAVLVQAKGREPGAFLFPGARRGRPLSENALLALLKRMGLGHVTAHGFRSTFRDWAGDCTSFPREVVEAALSHVVGDETERAYRRGDALEKRRELMSAWASYCAEQKGNVVHLVKAAG